VHITVAAFPELFEPRRWRDAPDARRAAIVDAVIAALDGALEPAYTRTYGAGARAFAVATLRDRTHGVLYNLVPGGTFAMGLSDAELTALGRIAPSRTGGGAGTVELARPDGTTERTSFPPNDESEFIHGFAAAASTMRPVHPVAVAPFLCARFPLLATQAAALLGADGFEDAFRPEFGDDDAPVAMYLTRDECARVLALTGARMLSEAEWEWAARATGATLFPFGDARPSSYGETPTDRTVARGELVCLASFEDEPRNDLASNAFGLCGLAVGEFCADAWHDDYDGAPDDGSAWTAGGREGAFVTRGGSAALWPWQDAGEWLTLASASRMPSTAFDGGTCGLRLARSLPLETP
jgi:formylglycine-generating enzyme required for sulfatase activity